MEPNLEDLRAEYQEEEIQKNVKKQVNEFKNKIGKQRRRCWWN